MRRGVIVFVPIVLALALVPALPSLGIDTAYAAENTAKLTQAGLLAPPLGFKATNYGYRANQGGGGALTTEWVTGSLGNTWAEGEWVPYQLVLTGLTPGWPGLDSIVVSWDFTVPHGGDSFRFVDLVRGIQAGTVQLTDSQGWPDAGGTAMPVGTRDELEAAQKSLGEHVWTGFTLLGLPNSQVNRTLSGGMDTPPGEERHTFKLYTSDLVAAGISTNSSTLVIYYQLHESRTFIWANSLEDGYDTAPTNVWGGYLYGTDGWPTAPGISGSGFVPGASGHVHVENLGGSQDVGVPIPEPLPGVVSGVKWLDADGDGVYDGGEETISGWEIHVFGTVEGIDFTTSDLTDASGYYSFSDLAVGRTWTIKEDSQRDLPPETGFTQTYPHVGTVQGLGTGVAVSGPPAGVAPVGWAVVLDMDSAEQPNLNFGNVGLSVAVVCPADLTVECDESLDPSHTGQATAEGSCSSIEITYSDIVIPGSCPQNYTIERTWTATCLLNGGFDSCVQTITVEDTTDPEITCPPDVTFECDDIGDAGVATAVDNCDPEPQVGYEDNTVPGSCPEAYTIERTWTATDACGNSDYCVQYIYIEDTTDPYFTTPCPEDDAVECDDIPDPPVMEAADACDPDVDVTFDEHSEPGTPPSYVIVRTWTATDDCGNEAVCEQRLTVVDTTAPEITCPPDVTFECDDIGDAGVATAVDNCDPSPRVDYDDATIPGDCAQAYTIERTWTATDAAGNSDYCVQYIHIEDTTDPYWVTECPGDATVECNQVPMPAEMEAGDACDPDVDVTFDEQTIPGDCDNGYTLVRTWVATDDCGNDIRCEQRLTVVDTTAPEITCPPDVTFECDDIGDGGVATAVDNCDPEPQVGYEDNTVPGSCPEAYTIERTWTATDACGNSDSDVQLIHIVDTTPPYFVTECPGDATVECDNVEGPPAMFAEDNCDEQVAVLFNEQRINGSSGAYTLVRTWTATDDCGNETQCEQVLTVVDRTPPQIICPADASFECDETVEFGWPIVTDNCDSDPVITFDDVVIPSACAQTYTIERTWTVTDVSGNSSSCMQTVTVKDTTPPTLACGADGAVGCNDPVVFTEPVATDNCDPAPRVDVLSYDIRAGALPCQEVHVNTWIATDACGNQSEPCSQTIVRMVDTTAPVLSAVEDLTLPCNAPVVFTTPVATDNCDPSPVVEIQGTTIDPGPGTCEETQTRCWVARDACGNVSAPVCQHIVRMVDTEPPVLTCAPDKTVPFGSEIVFDEPQVSDNCMAGSQIQSLETSTAPGPGGLETYTQCWIVVDDCGNVSNECCQTITMEAEPSPYCTFACWDWGTSCLEDENRDISTKPACIRDEYFYDVFPQGVVIGDPSRHTARWTSPEAVEAFGCGYGIPMALRRNYVNPQRNELGVLAGEILALRLNREFSCAGYLSSLGYGAPEACYGDFVIPDSVRYFGGLTVDEFLAVADQGVAGNTAAVRAYGANIDHLWATAAYLNSLFSDCGGQFLRSTGRLEPSGETGGEDVVEPASTPLPERLELTVRPNPLQSGTNIRLALPVAGEVSLDIYDVQGRKVAALMNGGVAPGYYDTYWGGSDDNGTRVGSGVYFCRLSIDGQPMLMQKLMKL